MTLDEKLNVFYDSTIADATNKSKEILVEYQVSLKNIFEEHKKEVQDKANFTLDVESKKLLLEKNKILSIQSMDYKRQMNEKTESLKKVLFKNIKQRLQLYMQTDDYKNLLTRQIIDALDFAKGEAITIYVNASDEDKIAFLKETTGVSVTLSTIDFMGGTRAVIHERNILIDRSFSSKFADEKNTFSL